MKRIVFLVYTFSVASVWAASPLVQTAPLQVPPLQPVFSTGPSCQFIAPSIHVYRVAEHAFISGSEVRMRFPSLAMYVNDRKDPGARCGNDFPLARIRDILGVDMDSSSDYIVFFMDFPGKAPFHPFSVESIERRNKVFHLFSELKNTSRVWIHMPPFIPEP